MEYEYLEIITTNQNETLNCNTDLDLINIPDYLITLREDYFKDVLYKDEDKRKPITRGEALLEFEEKAKVQVLEFIMKYSSIMPNDYKIMVFKIDNLLDSAIFPSGGFVKELLISEHRKFTANLHGLVTYFDDIDKKRVSESIEKEYGWLFIIFVTILFFLLCVFIAFCVFLYNS